MKKINAEKKQAALTATMQKINDLTTKRIEWQTQYDRTNKSLYDLLAECLSIYISFKGTYTEKDILDTIKKNLTDRGIKFQTSTPVLTLVVRYIFNSERRRAFTYSNAIAVAINNGVRAENFAAWVEQFGGVEEVVKTKAYSQETILKRNKLNDQIEEVKIQLTQRVKKPLAIIPPSDLIKISDTAEYTLLIGKTQANGETIVLSVVPEASEAMTENAIANIAKALIKLLDKEKTKDVENERDRTMTDAINTAQLRQLEAA